MTGEAAIVFPTADNISDGNLFLCLQGGYLRVMYPAPENCLNLPAWQEFYGFDKNSTWAWFGFEFDRETFTLSAVRRDDAPLPAPGPAKPVAVERDPEKVLTGDETSPIGEVLKSLKAATGSPDQRSGAESQQPAFGRNNN